MSDKKEYRELCASDVDMPVFVEPWWLDTVCGPDKWDVVVIEKGGSIQATMPYYMPEEGRIAMPWLTQTMGPWIRPRDGGKYVTELSREMKLMEKLIMQLPKHGSFLQNFHHTVSNWLPFYWDGFKQTTRYTYVFDDLSDLDEIWQSMTSDRRGDIRKAEKNDIKVITTPTFNDFYEVKTKTFARQNKGNPTPKKFMRNVYEKAKGNDAGKLFFAVDEQERIHATCWLVWNSTRAYYLAGGGDPELRSSGAQVFLMWEAIQFASTVSDGFDFEGSMLEGVENAFRKFGAKQKRYFQISKEKRSIAQKVASTLKRGVRQMVFRLTS